MVTKRQTCCLVTTATAVIAGLAAWSMPSADAQQRKSIRWATASVDSYGYKVAASMTKVVEEALGGEYTVTVNPYPATTSATKAAMEDDAEIGYTADIGMTQLYAGRRRVQELQARQRQAGPHLVRLPDGILHGGPGQGGRQIQVPEGLQRQAGVLHAGRLHELAELPAHVQNAGLRVQARPDRSQVQLRRPAGRHRRRLGRLYSVGQIAGAVLEGNRGADGRKVVNPCPDEIAKLKAAGLVDHAVDPKGAFSKDVGVKEIQGVPILFAYNVRADMPRTSSTKC